MRVPCQGLCSQSNLLTFELDTDHMKVFHLHYAALPAQLKLALSPQARMTGAATRQANLPVES